MYIFYITIDNNLGHGSYLISSNGYSWSHTEQANNIAVVGFKFKEGDIIQIQYDKTKLVYLNKASNQKHQLKLAFNQAEEKDIYFCANLCSDGDSVEIMEF